MATTPKPASLLPGLDEAWSRPRALRGVMQEVGVEIPQRLHRRRFSALLKQLKKVGIELGSVDRKLLAGGGSPGIEAKVRLRRVQVAPAAALPTLESVTLKNFKSFEDAELPLASLTLLIGANASGKSNALEAIEILAWLASGRRLSAESSRELRVRGEPRDLLHDPAAPIELGCHIAPGPEGRSLDFQIALAVGPGGMKIVHERLASAELPGTVPLYAVAEPAAEHQRELTVAYNNFARGKNKPRLACVDDQAVFTQLLTPARFGATHHSSQEEIPKAATRLRDALDNVLFLDPNPSAMRGYSFAHERKLDRQGRNLSAVLSALVDGGHKEAVLGFVRSLPEQRITDIRFVKGPRGDLMLQLVESFGAGRVARQRRDAVLLSDGTLRILAIAAALLSTPAGSMLVIEEVDNGVHPSRVADLLEQIQTIASGRSLRILLTTHNPALLDVLPLKALPDVVACYRDPASGASRLVRLKDLPRYPELISQGPLGRLVTRGVLDRFLKSDEDEEARIARALQFVDGLGGGV